VIFRLSRAVHHGLFFQPPESYSVANMKLEVQDSNVVRARYSRRPPCSATSSAAVSDAAGNAHLVIHQIYVEKYIHRVS